MAQVITDLFDSVDDGITVFISDTYGALAVATQPLFQVMVVAFIMLYGMFLYWGLIKSTMGDALINIVKIVFIWGLLTNFGNLYFDFFVDPLFKTPSEIAGSIIGVTPTGGSSTTSINAFLDNLWEEFLVLANKGDGVVGGWIVYLIILFGAVISIGYAVILILLAKISLALLLGLAPLFIIGLLFKGTSKFFEAWLQKCINYMLIPILTYGALLIPLKIINTVVLNYNAGWSDIDVGTAFFIFFICLLCFLVLMQVMQMSAGLAGGLSLSTMSVVALFTRGSSRSASWLNKRGKGANTWTGSAMSGAGRGVSNAGGRARAFVGKAWSGGSIRK
jgi:type IV secretion system protein VirB6